MIKIIFKSIYTSRRYIISVLISLIVIRLGFPMTVLGQFASSITNNIPIVGTLLTIYDVVMITSQQSQSPENLISLEKASHLVSVFIAVASYIKAEEYLYLLDLEIELNDLQKSKIKFVFSVVASFIFSCIINLMFLNASTKLADAISNM